MNQIGVFRAIISYAQAAVLFTRLLFHTTRPIMFFLNHASNYTVLRNKTQHPSHIFASNCASFRYSTRHYLPPFVREWFTTSLLHHQIVCVSARLIANRHPSSRVSPRVLIANYGNIIEIWWKG
jgi:hypothetical protein